ncbi:Holliday junction branch migration protein RuvA [Treponema primitia]|uniref:Holliday junction branch migration protein RuvA n=1 Tax=Treponema primitia TaxID=88058 RepID=UPI0002554E87|nr:Holliday junction branch migration protein RuvA [Treponema primitia]
MFNSIRGTVTGKIDDTLRILTGGLEWEIIVPLTDMGRFPLPGEEGQVYTWLYHREDQMRLFGFADEIRRATFLELLKVEGIGPKAAVKIMGGISQTELQRALDTEDVGRLEAVPGLGKKTAQKMILALKGKLTSGSDKPRAASPHGDLVTALAEMGYDQRSAADALAKAEASLPPGLSGAELEKALFRQAILYLSGA